MIIRLSIQLRLQEPNGTKLGIFFLSIIEFDSDMIIFREILLKSNVFDAKYFDRCVSLMGKTFPVGVHGGEDDIGGDQEKNVREANIPVSRGKNFWVPVGHWISYLKRRQECCEIQQKYLY